MLFVNKTILCLKNIFSHRFVLIISHRQLKNIFWVGTYVYKEKPNLQISDKTIRKNTYLILIQEKCFARGSSKFFLEEYILPDGTKLIRIYESRNCVQ